MRILLGLTGSVASVLAPKLTCALMEAFRDVEVIASHNSINFFRREDMPAVPFWQDLDEWKWDDGGNDRYTYKKDDPVLHIELRKRASALVIAPISANKIAEMANGLCPDLLTSVALAWDYCRPVVVAPAMNTLMWQHPQTQVNLGKLRQWGVRVVEPQNKLLACGDEGEGAMANIDEIVRTLKDSLRWEFPLGRRSDCPGIPVSHHPGAFGFHRKHSHHTGVDLYSNDEAGVFAVESGRIVNIERFTGAWDNSPWWEETECILVEGASGVVCYGEVSPAYGMHIHTGIEVKRGQYIATVKRVLKPGKERPDIPGHSTAMLHMELYPYGTRTSSKSWQIEPEGENCRRPEDLLDPTPQLIGAENAPDIRLSM